MLPAFLSNFTWRYTNTSAPSQTPGTSVVPGTSNAYGVYTQIAPGANITTQVYAVALTISGGFLSGVAKNHLLDIGVDPAGGVSYTSILTDLSCGNSSDFVSFGRSYLFPLSIPAGSSIAVKIKGSHTTAGTVRVWATFYGKPVRPGLTKTGQYAERIGAITNSSGVGFTPGGSGATGAWQSLGTTVKDLWWFQLGIGSDDTSLTTTGIYLLDLAVGSASFKHIIIDNLILVTPTVSEQMAHPIAPSGSWHVPAGSELFVRGSCDGTPDATWHAVAVGVGG